MPVILLSTQCPAPQILTALIKISDASEGNAPCSATVASGSTTFRTTMLNPNATRIDHAVRYGGGGVCIANGLVMSYTTGLTLTVSAGHGLSGGVVELASNTTISVPDGHNTATDRVWIWLLLNKTLAYTLTTTAPATTSVLIGSCTTTGGNITSIDTSGVMYSRGGELYRETADIGVPLDTPNSSLFFMHKTLAGFYVWSGTSYLSLVGGILSKSVAGGANVTLSNSEASNKTLILTGTLTANIDLIFPVATGREWVVRNNTAGAYTVTLKVSGGTGTVCTQSRSLPVFCDGTNIVPSGAVSAS